MHPEQKKIFAAMTPERKLRVASQLFRSAWQLKWAGVKAQHPDWADEKIRDRVKKSFLYARD